MDDDVKIARGDTPRCVYCCENYQMMPFSRGMLTGPAGKETEKRKETGKMKRDAGMTVAVSSAVTCRH